MNYCLLKMNHSLKHILHSDPAENAFKEARLIPFSPSAKVQGTIALRLCDQIDRIQFLLAEG